MQSQGSPQGEAEARLSRIVTISVLVLVALLAAYLVWGIGIPSGAGEASGDDAGRLASRAHGILGVVAGMGVVALLAAVGASQVRSVGGQALTRGASSAAPARAQEQAVAPVATPAVTFDDVAGVAEAAEELQEVVEFLREPARFAALGARVPRGVLLVGPPGTGKTLLARAVAGEAGVPFYSMSGSEFVEVYVGVGASRVRKAFQKARETAPSIIFIDEIDSIGRSRREGPFAANEEREQTLNQILVEMDGFSHDATVIVLAATNRVDVLDAALMRPGRFDRRVSVDVPDRAGRAAILAVHARGKPLAADVDLPGIAATTSGFTGADLANLMNEAAILAARSGKTTIGCAEMEEAVDRVLSGPERKGQAMSTRERHIVAYHESGHALVARALGEGSGVRKVSIVARGASGGQTTILPEDDRRLWSRAQLRATLACALGGMAAEQLVFGDITTGSENDLARATELAQRMVTSLGMSERLGPVAINVLERSAQGAAEAATGEAYREVSRLTQAAYDQARAVLEDNRATLDAVAAALLEQETLTGAELNRLCQLTACQDEVVGFAAG